MQLTVWTYEGPPHVGAMRVAASLRDVHLVLHAPQGDTYADLLFTMIERRRTRPPVTWTTFQARDLGGDTAALFQRAAQDAVERFRPAALLVGASCTAELIQDDPGGLTAALELDVPVVPLELTAYSRKEHWGAAETFYQLVRRLCTPHAPPPGTARAPRPAGRRPRVNLLGPCALGFRNKDDVREVRRLLASLGVDVHVVAPLGASVAELATLGEADANVVLYPEVGSTAATWLQRTFAQPAITAAPIGVGATRDFLRTVADAVGVDPAPALAQEEHEVQSAWYSQSVDATYLTGKRVFIFGDATHAVAAARVATEELGFTVVGLGTYVRERAKEVREAAARYGLTPLITDDYLEVEAAIAEAAPALVLGTQMERHVAKRLGVPCAVISAPVHVEDFPARHAPQMGWEGTNVLFDSWVHPLMMGLEEHLLTLFRGDFEFHDQAAPSHLGGTGWKAEEGAAVAAPPAATAAVETVVVAPAIEAIMESGGGPRESGGAPRWLPTAEAELKKIPFFVRGVARRNTERFAREQQLAEISVDTLYDAKAHFGR